VHNNVTTPRTKPLRIAWDNSLTQRNQTGSGVYAARLLEQLSRSNDICLEVFGDRQGISRPQSRLGRALGFAGSLAWIQGRLPFLLRGQTFDVLHSPAFITPVKSPCPKVVTIHDIAYLLYPSHFSLAWMTYMKTLMPLSVRSAAAIICGSENSRQDIIRAYGVAPHKVRVVPYGIDQRRFHPGAVLNSQWAAGLGIRDGYLLHVGALAERKNIPALLRAIANLRSHGKWGSRQLVLAGPAPPGMTGASAIYEAIQQLDLASSVVVAGHVPDEHIPGLYTHASALIMPSLYEGFGFPVLEAMSSGTPVIASNTSSLPEVAGDAALLVPPLDEQALADAIADVLECSTAADELRSKGLQRARQFSWKRTADETVKVYRSIASS
jgi:glycosyltransferase involved in cell wall biosynthesis